MVDIPQQSKLGLHREAEARLQRIAALLKQELPEGIVFALMTFTPGDGGYSGWVSNGQRSDMLKALKEMVARFEAQTDSGPFADVEELEMRKARHDRRADEAKRRRGLS